MCVCRRHHQEFLVQRDAEGAIKGGIVSASFPEEEVPFLLLKLFLPLLLHHNSDKKVRKEGSKIFGKDCLVIDYRYRHQITKDFYIFICHGKEKNHIPFPPS